LAPGGAPDPQSSAPQEPDREDPEDSVTFRPFERVEKLHPQELVELAPRLACHIPVAFPDWGDIVDAAGGSLRHELGVSQPLWGQACRILGRQRAAVTLAIVSTKPKGYFSRGAGGYFAAMAPQALLEEAFEITGERLPRSAPPAAVCKAIAKFWIASRR
jgi:replication initiation protein RepC